MYSILFVLAVVLTVSKPALASQSDWDQEARDYILKIHNDFRRGEGGCHMNKLAYDMELEKQAKEWAEKCQFKHEMIDGRGENLAYNTMEEPEKDLIKGSTQRWFDEKNRYSYGQHSCSSSCHYTQMVWGETTKVGCYTTRCPYLSGAAANSWYLVCFYTPKGNDNGVKPYEKSCPSQCQKGQTEDNKLCVGEATGGGNCKNDEASCQKWADSNQCVTNPKYMLRYCRKACKVCESSGDCEDKTPKCVQWAEKGQCQKNPKYMKMDCRKSCNFC